MEGFVFPAVCSRKRLRRPSSGNHAAMVGRTEGRLCFGPTGRSTGWVWTGLSRGILGFIPGITTNYDTMQVAGHESAAHLRGIVQISILHNLVHPLFGVVWPWREAG